MIIFPKQTNSLIRVVTKFLAKCHLDKRFALDSVEYFLHTHSLAKNSDFSNQLPTISFAERFENLWHPFDDFLPSSHHLATT